MCKIYWLTVQAEDITLVMMTFTEVQRSTLLQWHKRYTSEFSLWNGCLEHTNYSSLKYHKNRGNRLSFNCRLNLYMGYIMILRAVAQRINMTHWMSQSTLMCIHCLQWKIDRAHLSKSGLCFTPQLQWGGNWGIRVLHSIISFCAT